jgi:hypothetical protein
VKMKVLVVLAAASILAGCESKTPVVAPAAPPVVAPPAAAPVAPAAKSTYPLATCVVSGEKLGGMGDPVVIVRDGVEIHLCCNDCIKEVDKDPKKYVSMVTGAKKSTTSAPRRGRGSTGLPSPAGTGRKPGRSPWARRASRSGDPPR